MAKKFLLIAIFSSAILAGCASRSVLPNRKEVKVSRDTADSDCRELGRITGNTASTQGTREQALEDLKQEGANKSANKSANYVMIKEYSSYGTSVTGVAYECP